MKKVKRKYDSTQRKLLAARTRESILESARRLFSERGYGRTSIEEIAQFAGVAVPTVYSTYGSKRAILLQLLDEMEKRADAATLVEMLRDRPGEERAQLRAFVDFSVRLFTEDDGVVRIAELAGFGDPDIAVLWETGGARRLETCCTLVAGWERRGIFREGLTEERAVDILWSLSGPEFYSLFVRKRDWTPARFSDWLYKLADEQLFAVPSREGVG